MLVERGRQLVVAVAELLGDRDGHERVGGRHEQVLGHVTRGGPRRVGAVDGDRALGLDLEREERRRRLRLGAGAARRPPPLHCRSTDLFADHRRTR